VIVLYVILRSESIQPISFRSQNIWIMDHFYIFLTIAEWGILYRPTLTKLSEMTDANKIINQRHFGRDLADSRIRINPATRIAILDHFWLKFWRWRMFAFSEHGLVLLVC